MIDMPTFILNLLISLVLKFGLRWLFGRFPGLSERFPLLAKILQELVENVRSGVPEHVARKKAAHRIKKECLGVGCELDLK